MAVDRGTETLSVCRTCGPSHLLIVATGIHVATGPAYQALGARFDFTRSVK